MTEQEMQARITELEQQLADANRFLANESLTKRNAELEAENANLRAIQQNYGNLWGYLVSLGCPEITSDTHEPVSAMPDMWARFLRGYLERKDAAKERELANLRAELEATVTLLQQVIQDTADELGCAPDNEEMLVAVEALKADAARLDWMERYKPDVVTTDFDGKVALFWNSEDGKSGWWDSYREAIDAAIKNESEPPLQTYPTGKHVATSISELATPKQVVMIRALCIDLQRDAQQEIAKLFGATCKVAELTRRAAKELIDQLKGAQESEAQ